MVVGNKDYKSHVKTNTCGPNTVKLGIQNSTIYLHDIPNISGQFDNYSHTWYSNKLQKSLSLRYAVLHQTHMR